MAAPKRWTSNIEELPSEVLSCCVKAIAILDLQDIGNRISTKPPATGDESTAAKATRDGSYMQSWKRLVERLGFYNSDVDRLLARAKVENSCPGFLLLQDWAHRPGSTAYVLLHALREVQREDVMLVLLEKLRDVNTMLLFVSVEDRAGIRQYSRVRTRRNVPLHASLDNELSEDLYWYDITGPCPGLDWCTPSGQLQGAMLTLKLRDAPSQESRAQIYGIKPTGGCRAPGHSPPPQATPQNPPSGGSPQQPAPRTTMMMTTQQQQQRTVPNIKAPVPEPRHVSHVRMNVPPVQPSVSVTVDLFDPKLLNVKVEGPNIRLVKDLPSNQLSPVRQQQGGKSTHQSSDNYNIDTTGGLGAPKGQSNVSGVGPDRGQVRCKSPAVNELLGPGEPVSNVRSLGSTPTLPLLSDFSTFSSFSTRPGGDGSENSVSLNIPPVRKVDSSGTFLKVRHISSLTGAKQPVSGVCGASVNNLSVMIGENDVEKLKASAATFQSAGQLPGKHGERSVQGADRDSSSASTSTCCMHPEYVLPETLNQSDVKCRSVAQNPSQCKESHGLHSGLRKNIPVPAARSYADHRKGKPLPGSGQSSSASTLHPDYILPDKVKEISDSLRERSMTQLNIQVHSSSGGIRNAPESTNIITVVNNYGKDIGHETVSGLVHLAQSGSGSHQPEVCFPCADRLGTGGVHPVSPPHTYGHNVQSVAVSLARSAVGAAQPVTCFVEEPPSSGCLLQPGTGVVDQGQSGGSTAQSAALSFSSAPSARRTVQRSGRTVQSSAPAVSPKPPRAAQPGSTHVNPASVAEQSASTSANKPSSARPVAKPRVVPANQTLSPRSTAHPGSSHVHQPSSPRCFERRSPLPSRQRTAPVPWDTSAPGGPRPFPNRIGQQGLQRSASYPVLDECKPSRTTGHEQNNNGKNIAASSRAENSLASSLSLGAAGWTTEKGANSKPLPCTYTNNIIPEMSARALSELALNELNHSSRSGLSTSPKTSPPIAAPTGANWLTVPPSSLSRMPTSAEGPNARSRWLPQERAGATESPPRNDSLGTERRSPASPGVAFAPPRHKAQTVNACRTYNDNDDDDTYIVLPPSAVKNGPANTSAVPGWSPSITEDTVPSIDYFSQLMNGQPGPESRLKPRADGEMLKHLGEDGKFIVWRSPYYGQYAISVSYRRVVKHFWVYEKEDKKGGPPSFYIYPEDTPSPSLAALLDHCQKHGIIERPRPRAKKKEMMEQKACSSDRTVLVRLRTPVDVSSTRL